jgi:alpha-1,2-rhamnosyltransferase
MAYPHKRIFIDCTSTCTRGLHTGIERVVRNIIGQALSFESNFRFVCQAVIIKDGHFVPIASIEPSRTRRAGNNLRSTANSVYKSLTQKAAVLLPLGYRRYLTGTKHEPSLAKVIVFALQPLARSWRRLRHNNSSQSKHSQRVEFHQGDILLLADSLLNKTPWQAVKEAKSAGAHVAAIVYDIFPVPHPQFFAPSSQQAFAAALPSLLEHADTFMCISAHTKNQLQEYYQSHPVLHSFGAKTFDTFTLGAEIDTTKSGDKVRPKLISIFAPGTPVYLAVGTVEPRKNHDYLLRAFQDHWAQGSAAVLLIIGRIGWMCDDVLATIRHHPLKGKQLFFISDASDTELDYCYAHSKALLLASIVEGFGLPIVESLRKGLPVFASDIPVFHEVGGEHLAYFDLQNTKSLTTHLSTFEETGIFPAKTPQDFTWPDWSQCTEQLLKRLVMHSTKATELRCR